jgi:hypothetical protein
LKKKLMTAGVLAAGLVVSVGSSPAVAACSKHCWQECTYEAAGKCYVWAKRCEPVCTLPAWKYDKNLPKSSGGKWVPNSPSKGIGGAQPPLKWVPNSPSKGISGTGAPANRTWTPSSGANQPILRSGSGRR